MRFAQSLTDWMMAVVVLNVTGASTRLRGNWHSLRSTRVLGPTGQNATTVRSLESSSLVESRA